MAMEAEIERATGETEDGAAAVPSAPGWLLRLLGAFSLLAWALLILAGLFSSTAAHREMDEHLTFSLSAFAGFYLACGNFRWWARWLVAACILLLIVFAYEGPSFPEEMTYFGVLAMISAGLTFAGRMILSAVRGESSPRQRFTIFGLMLATAITSVCAVAMNQHFGLEESPAVGILIALLFLIGFAMTAQFAATWARTKWEILAFAAAAILVAFPTPFLVWQLIQLTDGAPMPVEDILYPMGMMTFFTWLILYPLWFSFYALGWKLIDPSWKLGPRYAAKPTAHVEVKEVDVLMED
ncbi:hypothetical protein [Bremerella sp.]|uniref:hypothetical protein n=1 Tax=Bremerella sp. TaxID=2795602 RepID=UPI00391978E2